MKTFVIEEGRGVPTWDLALPYLATLLILFSTAVSVAGSPLHEGIWLSDENKRSLSKQHEEELLLNLRQITGLCELRFEEDGSLSLGDTSDSSDGSLAARQILSRALDSGQVFLIEDHSGSDDVNFGQMDEGTRYEDSLNQRKFLIWRVRLDFEDFRKMAAPNGVRKSFSVGFTFLHELLHGLGHKDAQLIRELGECEEQINQARLELNLPTRDQYFAEQQRITGNFFTLRLKFRDHTRRRDEFLFFLAPPGSKIVEITEAVVTVRRQSR